jgi:hypothetical protein
VDHVALVLEPLRDAAWAAILEHAADPQVRHPVRAADLDGVDLDRPDVRGTIARR